MKLAIPVNLLTTTTICLLSFLSTNAQNIGEATQEELRNLYDSTAMLELSNGYEIDGKKYKKGIFNGKLKKELKRSPAAWESYKMYRNRTLLGFGMLVAMVPVYTVATIATLNPGVGIIATTPVYIGAIVAVYSGVDQYQRAIWLYNRDAISGGLSDS